MKLTISTIFAVSLLSALPVRAQQNSFWNSYYAAQNGFNNSFNQGMMAQSLQTQRAMVNSYRQANHLPPCHFGLVGLINGDSC